MLFVDAIYILLTYHFVACLLWFDSDLSSGWFKIATVIFLLPFVCFFVCLSLLIVAMELTARKFSAFSSEEKRGEEK